MNFDDILEETQDVIPNREDIKLILDAMIKSRVNELVQSAVIIGSDNMYGPLNQRRKKGRKRRRSSGNNDTANVLQMKNLDSRSIGNKYASKYVNKKYNNRHRGCGSSGGGSGRRHRGSCGMCYWWKLQRIRKDR